MCQESHRVGEISSLEDPELQLKWSLWLDLVSPQLQMLTNQFGSNQKSEMWEVIVFFSPNFLFTFLGLKAAWKQSLLFTVRATISMVTGEYEEYNRVPELICSKLLQLISGKLKKKTVSKRLKKKKQATFVPI